MQHYLPLDRLLVHDTANVDETDVKADETDFKAEESEVIEDDAVSSSGEAKSRRKNSKFLERGQRQAVAINSTTSTTLNSSTSTTTLKSSASTNEDDFESLATETATKQVIILLLCDGTSSRY